MIFGRLRAGANLLAASCNILAGTLSGPVALFVFNSFSNLATPFVVMVMSGIAGTFEYGSFGKLVFSFVKTFELVIENLSFKFVV